MLQYQEQLADLKESNCEQFVKINESVKSNLHEILTQSYNPQDEKSFTEKLRQTLQYVKIKKVDEEDEPIILLSQDLNFAKNTTARFHSAVTKIESVIGQDFDKLKVVQSDTNELVKALQHHQQKIEAEMELQKQHAQIS